MPGLNIDKHESARELHRFVVYGQSFWGVTKETSFVYDDDSDNDEVGRAIMSHVIENPHGLVELKIKHLSDLGERFR